METAAESLAYIGNSSYCPHQAAAEFAKTFWEQPRKLENYHQDGMTASFCVKNGLRTYQAAWDDAAGQFSITLR